MKKKNVFYAQSGGVTAVINASACGVIETARKHKNKLGKVYAGCNGILGALTEDMIDTTAEIGAHDCGAPAYAGRRVRLRALQAQGPRQEPRRVRAPHRGLQGARHRLLLLQRRRRLDGHRPQGLAARQGARLPDRLHRRAEDRRQRSADHRHVPRLRLRREIRRGVHARSRARRRVDGAHLDARVHPRGHGPARGLDRRGRRARRREPRPTRRTSSCSPRFRSTRPRSSRASRTASTKLRVLRRRRLGRRALRRRPVPRGGRRQGRVRPCAARRRRGDRRAARARPSSGTNTTTRSRTTCSARRATSRRKSTSSRRTPWAKPPSSSRLKGENAVMPTIVRKSDQPYRWRRGQGRRSPRSRTKKR